MGKKQFGKNFFEQFNIWNIETEAIPSGSIAWSNVRHILNSADKEIDKLKKENKKLETERDYFSDENLRVAKKYRDIVKNKKEQK